MQRVTLAVLMAMAIAFGGCKEDMRSSAPKAEEIDFLSSTEARARGQSVGMSGAVAGQPVPQSISPSSGEFNSAVAAASTATASASAPNLDRKIIRNAELRLETGAPDEGQQKIASIADKHGGFVVTSEARQNQGNVQTQPARAVNIVIRIPVAKFDAALNEIRAVGGRVLHEKQSGQDVTEEFLDVEARLRAKRALEAQFLEIMKRATKVSEALEVQSQLASVRAEIEVFEGRRRFLENQAELSTINVTLHTPIPVLATTGSGLWFNVKSAFGDGLEQAVGVVLGLIRFVIVMIPVLLLIVAPVWFALKWLRRRVSWPRRRTATASVVGQD